MPIDPTKLRRITDHNDQVIEGRDGVKEMSRKLEKLDPRNCDITSTTAKAWAQNVRELKVSLEEQQGIAQEMRESARIQDEQHRETFRDKYRFLVDRLKSDIRVYFAELKEFVDLPMDFTSQRTWDHCVYDMETDLKHLSALNAGDSFLTSVDPIVMLLNYRDKVLALLLGGVLFQAAVLHWDLKSERAYADGPMVEMAEQVVDLFSKNNSLPAKYILSAAENLPVSNEIGPFTQQKSKSEPGATGELTVLECRMLTSLREMRSLDKGLRNLNSGMKVHIQDKNRATGKNASSDDLRKEITMWFDKYTRMDAEMQNSKGQKQTTFEVQVEQLVLKAAEKDKQNKQHITRVHTLESDVQGWRYELANLKREKGELAETNAKMAKENLPVLDKMEKVLSKSCEAVERLATDAEKLSIVFKQQVQENRRTLEEREEREKDLMKVHRQLKIEKQKNFAKEDELQKKETLYLRTMAARKSIHEAYLTQKEEIVSAEEQMQRREAEWQEMLKVLEGRDSEIRQLQRDLKRARDRKEELRRQKQMCVEEYQRVTGRPADSLLQTCSNIEPTQLKRIPASSINSN